MPRKIPASLDQEVRYDLPVTTVLFPRFPNHQLTQSIGAKLAVWIPKLCIAWGWRATSVEIRPTHLQMTLRLSPEVAPAQAIQRIARDLSHQILRTFPHLARDLPSQRFWAKGYLLTTGTSLDPKHTRAFLKKIRRNQGLNS
jgi:REP element-mobilizing transposase RayT